MAATLVHSPSVEGGKRSRLRALGAHRRLAQALEVCHTLVSLQFHRVQAAKRLAEPIKKGAKDFRVIRLPVLRELGVHLPVLLRYRRRIDVDEAVDEIWPGRDA